MEHQNTDTGVVEVAQIALVTRYVLGQVEQFLHEHEPLYGWDGLEECACGMPLTDYHVAWVPHIIACVRALGPDGIGAPV